MKTPRPSERTLSFYSRCAATFIENTQGVEMSPHYEKFLPYIPAGGHILDAGCGSGRDALAFTKRGFVVTAFDGSPEIARISALLTGLPIQVLRFDEIEWDNAFEGVWACASLLHVPTAELPGVIERLRRALKPQGVLYASFKRGQGERWRGERYFVDFEIESAQAWFEGTGEWIILDAWETKDARPELRNDSWINVMVRKTL